VSDPVPESERPGFRDVWRADPEAWFAPPKPELSDVEQADVAVVCAFDLEARALGTALNGWKPHPQATFGGWEGRSAGGARWLVFSPNYASVAAMRAATLQARRLCRSARLFLHWGRGVRFDSTGPLSHDAAGMPAVWGGRGAALCEVPKVIFAVDHTPPDIPLGEAEVLTVTRPPSTLLEWKWMARHLAGSRERWLDLGLAGFEKAMAEIPGLPPDCFGDPVNVESPRWLSALCQVAPWDEWLLEAQQPISGVAAKNRRRMMEQMAVCAAQVVTQADTGI